MSKTRSTTRARILQAAAEIFGRHGFRAATVRRIAELAGANGAAVNYYFRDKQGLYGAVLEELLVRGLREFPPQADVDARTPAEEKLEIFLRSFFNRLLGGGGLAGAEAKGRLLAKEFSDPSPALEWLVEKHIRPQQAVLSGIVSELAGPGADRDALRLAVLSVIGQCLHYAYARPVISKLIPGFFETGADPATLARHVTRFSLDGIRRLSEPPHGPAGGPTGICKEDV
jgi:AcrR family transcriptional regulator